MGCTTCSSFLQITGASHRAEQVLLISSQCVAIHTTLPGQALPCRRQGSSRILAACRTAATHGCRPSFAAPAGDRPIEVTLQRAWRALTWRQKLDLGRAAVQLATSRMEVDAGVVEDMKSDAAVSAFEANLAENFPEVRQSRQRALGPRSHPAEAPLS